MDGARTLTARLTGGPSDTALVELTDRQPFTLADRGHPFADANDRRNFDRPTTLWSRRPANFLSPRISEK